jgi:hypothetical protein
MWQFAIEMSPSIGEGLREGGIEEERSQTNKFPCEFKGAS